MVAGEEFPSFPSLFIASFGLFPSGCVAEGCGRRGHLSPGEENKPQQLEQLEQPPAQGHGALCKSDHLQRRERIKKGVCISKQTCTELPEDVGRALPHFLPTLWDPSQPKRSWRAPQAFTVRYIQRKDISASLPKAWDNSRSPCAGDGNWCCTQDTLCSWGLKSALTSNISLKNNISSLAITSSNKPS